MPSVHEINWIAVEGDADVGQDMISFDPARGWLPKVPPGVLPATGNPDFVPVPNCTLTSSKYFQRGQISFEVNLGDEKCRCQFVLNHRLPTYILVGLNTLDAAFGILSFKPGAQQQQLPQWQPLAVAKIGGHPPINRWLRTTIKVFGSNISLSVEDVIVATAQVQVQINHVQLGLFLEGNAHIKVKNISIEAENPRAFIVMQFKEPFNTLYAEVIRPVCESFGYEVVRADDIYTSGLIIKEITQSIQEASVIVADITAESPNVYYEVGYAHALNKPTILLSDKTQERLPFDVSGFRTLFYEDSIGGKRKVEDLLKKHLQSVSGIQMPAQ